MSDTLVIGDEPAPTRRTPRQVREIVREDDEPRMEIEDGPAARDPEEELAASRQALKDANKATEDARRFAREESQRRQRAEADAQRAATARTTDHQAVVAAALESATSEMDAAQQAIILAREAGDVRQELEAQKRFNAANYRALSAQTEIERIKTAAPGDRPPQDQGPPRAAGPTPEAKAWLDSHPRFFEDQRYRAFAEGAANAALRAGHQDGSQGYVDFIEAMVADQFGEGHGVTPKASDRGKRYESDRGDRSMNVDGGDRGSRGDGLPPSRGGSPSGGYKVVKTPMGELRVRKEAGGAQRVQFTKPEQQEDFAEGARVSKMTLAEYVQDQIAIAAEMEAGGNGDWIKGDGEVYR